VSDGVFIGEVDLDEQAHEPLTLQDINGTRRDAQTLEECGQGLRQGHRHFRLQAVVQRTKLAYWHRTFDTLGSLITIGRGAATVMPRSLEILLATDSA
jgi:hypothetical protein